MSKYFNGDKLNGYEDSPITYVYGSCSTCMFAERDERGRYLGRCSGFSNCSYEEYKGKTDITEEEKDEKIAQLQFQLSLTEKALELLAEEFIGYEQSLKEECVIEGGILTDIGYEMTKKFLIDKVKFNAKEMMKDE